MSRVGCFASKADPDIWMKDCGNHYSHVAVYVDDCLYAGKDGKVSENSSQTRCKGRAEEGVVGLDWFVKKCIITCSIEHYYSNYF